MERPLHIASALRTIATSNTITRNQSPTSLSCGGINSPMTNLAHNLSELSTGRGVTPRRKLSLYGLDTPNQDSGHHTTERSISTESGCFVDSPTPLESPTFEMGLPHFPNFKASGQSETLSGKRKTIAFRRVNSMPVPMMRLSPEDLDVENNTALASTQSTNIEGALTLNMDKNVSSRQMSRKATFYIDETSSQDSGLECDRDSQDANSMEESFEFAAPQGMPPMSRRHKMISEDTCSPFKYSPVKISPSERRGSCPVGSLDFSGEIVKSLATEECPDSPLKMSRLTSVDEGIIEDDGFLDVMDAEVASLTTCTGGSMSSLFNAPLINKRTHLPTTEDDTTPVTRRVISRRNLSRCQSLDGRRGSLAMKRVQPEDNGCSPVQFSFKGSPQNESTPIQEMKRRRPASVIESPRQVSKPVLHRCHSESEAMIKSALNRQADEPDLVGDCSRTYCLPTFGGKHQDLKSISSQTLSSVIRGEYDNQIEKAIIVDCRYPYEYQGGHITGAKNLYTNDEIIEEFLKKPIVPTNKDKRIVIIFHCEFSSERGPKLSRFLRKQDRQANKDCYPNLYYPELYLLDGGYKSFFETEKANCVPQTYKPMLHKDHGDDLRHFRIKSKSWAGDRVSRPGFRPLKF